MWGLHYWGKGERRCERGGPGEQRLEKEAEDEGEDIGSGIEELKRWKRKGKGGERSAWKGRKREMERTKGNGKRRYIINKEGRAGEGRGTR